jgi:hypothetical protein
VQLKNWITPDRIDKIGWFKKPVSFVSSFRKSAIIGIILGGFLSFLIIFLEPFDTNQYESANKHLILSGYGFLLTGYYVLQSWLENLSYRKRLKWKVSDEIIAAIIFFTTVGTIMYLYNQRVVNQLDYSLSSHGRYYRNIVVVFVPVLLPVWFYLRVRFGELPTPTKEHSRIALRGENKHEVLYLEKSEIFYVKAEENYVRICFYDHTSDQIDKKTFRLTLSRAEKQLPHMVKSHRSYLVNADLIDSVKGNSQKATLLFKNLNEEVPLSKTYYKTIKSLVSENELVGI